MEDVGVDEWDAIWANIGREDIERVSRIVRRVLDVPAVLLSSTTGNGESQHRFPSGDQHFLPHGTIDADPPERSDETAEFDAASAMPVLASVDAHLFASGHRIGTLSVFDRSPRSWSEDDRAILVDLADCLSELIVLRYLADKPGDDRRPARVEAAHHTVTEPTPPDEEGEAAPGPGSHILLADDLDLNRKLICDMLSLEGHVVDSVPDGAAAVRAAGETQYDLILMDMIMPGMDGVAATRAIRALPAPACEVPIVALTAHSLPEQLESCLQAGMDATLVKPMTMDALTSAVATWTRTRRKAA